MLWVVSELIPGSRYSGAYKLNNLAVWHSPCFLAKESCFLFIQCEVLSLFTKQDNSCHFQMWVGKDNEISKISFIEWFLFVSFTIRAPATRTVFVRWLLNICGTSEHILCPNYWMNMIIYIYFPFINLRQFYPLLIGNIVLYLQIIKALLVSEQPQNCL